MGLRLKVIFIPIILCLLLFNNCTSFAKSKPSQKDFDLLNEYKLLYTDLINFWTWGYKSFYMFDITSDARATGIINLHQGAIMQTGLSSDVAIIEDGFFKIRLENDKTGFTRSGEFYIDGQGNLVSPRGYSFYDNINLGENFLSDTLKISRDGKITVNIVTNSSTLTETDAGQLVLYKIPAEILSHYKDAVYVIKDGVEYHEEIADNGYLLQGFLEMSNFSLMDLLLRMYYILFVIEPGLIANTEFKKEIMRQMLNSYIDINRAEETYEKTTNIAQLSPYLRYDY
jgi:flagellar basal body rod protein FlgF